MSVTKRRRPKFVCVVDYRDCSLDIVVRELASTESTDFLEGLLFRGINRSFCL